MWTKHRYHIKRQYTICNSLTPDIYMQLKKMAAVDI